MNKVQKNLFEKHLDLAETLAFNATCIEADYEMLLPEAERALAKAVMEYNKGKHCSFEKYATSVIKRALNRMINGDGDEIFSTLSKREKVEKSLYFASGEEVLKAELKIIHKSLKH